MSKNLRVVPAEDRAANGAPTQQTGVINKAVMRLHQSYTSLNNFLLSGHGKIRVHVGLAWLNVRCLRVVSDDLSQAQIDAPGTPGEVWIHFNHGALPLAVYPGVDDEKFLI